MYFVLSQVRNWEVICIIPIFEVILVKIWEFDPPPSGDPTLDYKGQIPKGTPGIDSLPPKITKMSYYTRLCADHNFLVVYSYIMGGRSL